VKRLLSPSTNATGLGAAVAGIYAAIQMVINLTSHKAGYGFDPQVIVAAVGAALFLWTRFKVTPVADPRDGNGNPLVSALAVDVAALNRPAPVNEPPGNVVASSGNVTVLPPGQPAPPPANGPRM